MEIEDTKKIEKIEKKFICDICDYTCSYLCDWNKHINTRKHKVSNKWKLEEIESTKNNEKIESFTCDCGKVYYSKSGLYKHKKACNNINNEKPELNVNNFVTIINQLIKQNDELKTLLFEQQSSIVEKQTLVVEKILDNQSKFIEQSNELIKNGSYNTTNNDSYNTTNSHNKAFNLNFYLNETCKNAMNMSEFIDSINLQLSDLERVGELGYVEGISKIIVDNLNKLDATERPVNCTDKKRETMYIKDDNKWEKDDENQKLNKAVKKIAYKNTKLFPQYKQKYPEYKDADSIYSDQYSKIVIESLKDDRENNEKVIKNISKVTTIKEK